CLQSIAQDTTTKQISKIAEVKAFDTIAQKPGNGLITVGGFVDFYYAFSLNRPKAKDIPYAFNYSRDDEFNINLAFISAKYESDVKFTALLSKKWTLTGLVLNGWGNIRQQNRGKAIGTQIQFKPSDKILFNSSTYAGNDKPDSAKQFRYFHDFYIVWKITPK